jgi:hypothetical protein
MVSFTIYSNLDGRPFNTKVYGSDNNNWKIIDATLYFRCRLQMEPPLPLYQQMETDMVVVKSMDVQHNLKVNKNNKDCCESKK